MTVDKLSRMSSTGDNRAGEGFRKTSEDIWKEASRKVGNNTQREMAAERSKSEHTDKRTYSGFGRFDECSREKVRKKYGDQFFQPRSLCCTGFKRSEGYNIYTVHSRYIQNKN